MNPVAKPERHPFATWLLIGAILVAAIIIDYLTPWPYVMTPLYALPMLVAAWRQAPRSATITAILANLINLASGVLQGTPREIWPRYSSGLIIVGILSVLVTVQRQHLVQGRRICARSWRTSKITQS